MGPVQCFVTEKQVEEIVAATSYVSETGTGEHASLQLHRDPFTDLANACKSYYYVRSCLVFTLQLSIHELHFVFLVLFFSCCFWLFGFELNLCFMKYGQKCML